MLNSFRNIHLFLNFINENLDFAAGERCIFSTDYFTQRKVLSIGNIILVIAAVKRFDNWCKNRRPCELSLCVCYRFHSKSMYICCTLLLTYCYLSLEKVCTNSLKAAASHTTNNTKN